MDNWIHLTLDRVLLGKGPGEIRVPAGKDGQPKERFWRDRLRDGTTDGSCVLTTKEKAKPKKKKGENSPDQQTDD